MHYPRRAARDPLQVAKPAVWPSQPGGVSELDQWPRVGWKPAWQVL